MIYLRKPISLLSFLALMWLAPTGLIAQTIDLNKLNTQLLDSLLWNKLDSLRSANGLFPLVPHKALQNTSYDHVTYLQTNRKLTEKQEVKGHETPLDRALAQKANFTQLSENLIQIPINIPWKYYYYDPKAAAHKTTTYQEAVHDIFLEWTNHKLYAANLLDPRLTVAGLASAYTPGIKELRVVMDLAEFAPNYPEPLVAAPTGKSCAAIQEVLAKTPPCFVAHQFMMPYEQAKQLMSKAEVYISYLPNNSFDCNAQPLYKHPAPQDSMAMPASNVHFLGDAKTLFQESLKHSPKQRKQLGKLPIHIAKDPELLVVDVPSPKTDLEDLYQTQLLFATKEGVCASLPVEPYGDMIDPFLPQLPYILATNETPYPPSQLTEVVVDTLRLKVFFAQNQYEASPEDLAPIMARLQEDSLTILDAKIEVFASVEGDFEANKELYTKRAASFLEVFKAYEDSSFEYKVDMEENWRMFFEQIRSTKFDELNGKNKDELRAYVNKNAKKKQMAALLAKQRYAFVRMVTEKEVDVSVEKQQINEFMISKFNSMASLAGELRVKNKTRVIKNMLNIQSSLYTGVANGEVDIEVANRLDIQTIQQNISPANKQFMVFIFNKIVCDYLYGAPKTPEKEFYSQLIELSQLSRYVGDRKLLVRDPQVFKQIMYNVQAFLVTNWEPYLDDIVQDKYMHLAASDDQKREKARLKREIERKQKRYGNFQERPLLKIPILVDEVFQFAKLAERNGLPEMVTDRLRLFCHQTLIAYHFASNPFNTRAYTTSLSFVKKYYSAQLLPDDFRVFIAGYYYLLGEQAWAKQELVNLLEETDSNPEIWKHYLKLVSLIDGPEQFAEAFLAAKDKLTTEDIESLFFSDEPYRIGHDCLKDQRIRQIICK